MRARLIRLVERATGMLAGRSQAAAIAPVGHGAILLGGLTAADTSRAGVDRDRRATSRGRSFPSALHDTAAVRSVMPSLSSAAAPATRSSMRSFASRLPEARASRSGGCRPRAPIVRGGIGGTAYIVGGYTGTRWLDTIVAWRPGRRARVVAHLPIPLRYAAVTAVGRATRDRGRLARERHGERRCACLQTRDRERVIRIGRLPAPTTHAAAATIGGSPT